MNVVKRKCEKRYRNKTEIHRRKWVFTQTHKKTILGRFIFSTRLLYFYITILSSHTLCKTNYFSWSNLKIFCFWNLMFVNLCILNVEEPILFIVCRSSVLSSLSINTRTLQRYRIAHHFSYVQKRNTIHMCFILLLWNFTFSKCNSFRYA